MGLKISAMQFSTFKSDKSLGSLSRNSCASGTAAVGYYLSAQTGAPCKAAIAQPGGTLEVNVADISATDLMEQPCPPHIALTANDQNMHRADALDGTANSIYNVNLYFKNTNNEIYTNNVGAARWRNKK